MTGTGLMALIEAGEFYDADKEMRGMSADDLKSACTDAAYLVERARYIMVNREILY